MADRAYGLWPLVILNTALFVVFAASFFHPRTGRDWRAMGAFTAFLVALFTEMYGIPLTVYLLSGWLGSKVPGLQPTHAGGHLFNDLIGWGGDPHLSPFHLASYLFIGGGFWLIAAAWRVLHDAARTGRLATTGAYAWVRHPQYDGFLLIMIGFLLQWPTIPTLVMFPILVFVYTRLARAEEREVAARFGNSWQAYAARTPAFLPRRRPGPPADQDHPAPPRPGVGADQLAGHQQAVRSGDLRRRHEPLPDGGDVRGVRDGAGEGEQAAFGRAGSLRQRHPQVVGGQQREARVVGLPTPG